MKTITSDCVSHVLSLVMESQPSLVFVHSSIGVFGKSGNPVDLFLQAWIRCRTSQTTLIMPTFTFSFCRSGFFDKDNTPSETGILSEVFRLSAGVKRSAHPIYSVAALGPRADEVCHLTGESCWGPGTIFELLEHENALIVGFGVPLARAATIMHRPEELLDVPYRYKNVFGARERPTQV